MTVTAAFGVQSDSVAFQRRLARAQDEHITVQLTDEDGWVVQGDSGNSHLVIMTNGTPQECSCPDCRLNGNVCKHMIAVDRCTMDEIVFSTGDRVGVSA